MFLDDTPELNVARILIEDRPFKRKLRNESHIDRQAPRLWRVEMRKNSKAAVLDSWPRNNRGKHHETGSNLIGDAGRPFRAEMQLALKRRNRAIELCCSGQHIVQVRFVGERSKRQRFILKDLNLKGILRACGNAHQWQ